MFWFYIKFFWLNGKVPLFALTIFGTYQTQCTYKQPAIPGAEVDSWTLKKMWLKTQVSEKRALHYVLEQRLKRYLFTPGESNCTHAQWNLRQTDQVQWTSMKRWLSCHFREQVLNDSPNDSYGPKRRLSAEKTPFHTTHTCTLKWQLTHLFIQVHCTCSVCLIFHCAWAIVVFTMGEEVSFQPLFKNIGEKLVFQIGEFSATCQSKFQNSTSAP